MKKSQKYNYTIRYRIKSKDGIWGNWITGHGIWEGIELVQRQLTMIKKAYIHNTLEIELQYKGEFLNYQGVITGKTIIYEK